MVHILEYITTGMGDGGAETLVKDYARMLDTGKYKITIVTINPLNRDSANYNRLIENNIEVISIYEKPKVYKSVILQKIWNRFFHKRFVSNRLLQIIEEKRVNTIHCHLEVLYSIVPIAQKIKNVKLFWTCHNEPQIIFKPKRWENEEKSLRYLIKNNGLRMIALHEEMRQELNNMFNVRNTITIHNGIDFNKFKDISESKEEIRQSINIPINVFVVGHVGRFTEAKNHNFLVDVFFEVCKKREASHLLLIGAGEKKQAIVDKLNILGLSGKYTILSHRTDIPQLLRAMDVFVFPSIYEGLPVSMVEAQVAGLRTIASDSVTKECFFSNNAISININESPSVWANVILDKEIKSNYDRDIELFDMSKEIIRLGKLYEKD